VDQSPYPYHIGRFIGRLLATGMGSVVFVALLLIGYFTLVVYPRTASVRLENDSMGTSTFYVDGNDACNASPNTFCTVVLRVYRSHTLSAYTSYSETGGFNTPEVTLQANANEAYRFLSCGETGSPGSNCGLFLMSTAPAEY
jgi:hypothetical protein